MTRIEGIVKRLLREGEVDNHEAIAILGSVQWVARHIDREPWAQSYGTFASEALEQLINEE